MAARRLPSQAYGRTGAGQLTCAPMSAPLPYPWHVGFDRLYGLQIIEIGDGEVRGRVDVSDQIKQPAGLVHGGVYAAMAESLATNGTAAAVHSAGNTAVGLSNQT